VGEEVVSLSRGARKIGGDLYLPLDFLTRVVAPILKGEAIDTGRAAARVAATGPSTTGPILSVPISAPVTDHRVVSTATSSPVAPPVNDRRAGLTATSRSVVMAPAAAAPPVAPVAPVAP